VNNSSSVVVQVYDYEAMYAVLRVLCQFENNETNAYA